MKKLLILLAFFPIILQAKMVCHGDRINLDQLESISDSVDLAGIVEKKNNVDLVLLGYFGRLCGIKELEKEFCFEGYDKEAAYQVFYYFRKIYRQRREVHLHFVSFPEEEASHVLLNFSVNGENLSKKFKRCQHNSKS